MNFIPKRRKAPKWFSDGWKVISEYRDEATEILKLPSQYYLQEILNDKKKLSTKAENLSKFEKERFNVCLEAGHFLKNYLFAKYRLEIMEEDFNFAIGENMAYKEDKQIIVTKRNPVELLIEKAKKVFGKDIKIIKTP